MGYMVFNGTDWLCQGDSAYPKNDLTSPRIAAIAFTLILLFAPALAALGLLRRKFAK